MNETGLKIVTEAERWLGTPYHHMADVIGVGVDCAMLPVRVFAALGLIPADTDPRPYPYDWMLHRDEERYLFWVNKFADPVTVPRDGDLALFRVGRCIAHGGIFYGDGMMIHADMDARKVERREIDTVPNLQGFWRLRA
jgi:cell wall-associated NlpC family hydrolase